MDHDEDEENVKDQEECKKRKMPLGGGCKINRTRRERGREREAIDQSSILSSSS